MDRVLILYSVVAMKYKPENQPTTDLPMAEAAARAEAMRHSAGTIVVASDSTDEACKVWIANQIFEHNPTMREWTIASIDLRRVSEKSLRNMIAALAGG